MKRTQNKKRGLGNKGFSLVELIVVIAIMAILIAVLAPTLFGNIEKSRESRDFNTLDSVYTAVKTAYGDDAGMTAAIDNFGDIDTLEGVLLSEITAAAHTDAFATVVKESLTSGTDLRSEIASTGDIYVSIINNRIRVWVGNSAAAVESARILDADGNHRTFEVE